MNRPLIITDCDEVLLHMVVPFAAWLEEEHGVLFRMEDASFANALRHAHNGQTLDAAEVWPLLDAFFTHQMHRQTAIPGAVAALNRLADMADIVILTNVGPAHQAARSAQLAAIGLHHRVIGSRGGKGEPVAALISQMQPAITLFIDDLPQHHQSVGAAAGDVWRLHMVGEPAIAHKVPASPAAHARIDDWPAADAWIAQRLLARAP
ncbi:MAG: HAD family hydrolase, partial [Sphingopyxis sp.]